MIALPTMPPELNYALMVNISDLRPWEFWEADSAELFMVSELKRAYQDGRSSARSQIDATERMKAANSQ